MNTTSTPPTPRRIGVVVVNYGSHRLLAANLVPLSAELTEDAVVVVVDNRTTDRERAEVQALAAAHGWRTSLPETNLGFGGGMNAGCAEAICAGATHLLLLNPDAACTRGAVDALVRRLGAEPDTMVGPTVVRPDGSPWSSGTDLHLDRGRMRATRRREAGDRVEPWLSGACLMISASLWQRVGGFDDDYFLYWEDVDLSRRVSAIGGELAVEPNAIVVHDEGGTHDDPVTSGRAKSPTYYYYNARNRLLYADRHLSQADRRRWRRTWPAAAWELLMQGGRRQMLHPVVPVRAVLRGSVDGLRGRCGPVTTSSR